jgi:glutamate synthase domain-containing protein 2/glutamate synthase domain-containing protein 1/glutamate synthase domain-containing protein 3
LIRRALLASGNTINPNAAPPAREGLYDPANEHDACGLGFVSQLQGVKSRDVVENALTVLCNLAHRGAAGSDPATGDGAGLLTQIPHAFFWKACVDAGFTLPEAGTYGIGMVFLPVADARRRECERLIERVITEEGWRTLGWRDVPVDPQHAGEQARLTQPLIRQLFLARAGLPTEPDDEHSFERALYLIRKRIERALRTAANGATPDCHVVSLSSRTIIYKGMLHAEQLRGFYRDLADPEFISAIAIVHSRFSTNTFPSWPLAHPYRFVAHNGEINTVRGNARWMRMREPALASPRFPDGAAALWPVIADGQSDSASLDNVLELLIHAGRPIAHAMAMLMPEAWESDALMPPDRRAFYEYHASLVEPWDGPAAVLFSDGRHVGATLDRNGLRPIRYLVTDDDVVILASEAGALPVDSDRIRTKGRLQPGQMLIVNTVTGRILTNADVKSELASLRPYRRWIAEQRVTIGASDANIAVDGNDLVTKQRAFGYTREELKMVLAPMAESGEEAIGSMGNDTPLAVLSDRPQLLFSYFRQLFAQVTNPAIDPIREQLVMSLGMFLGPQGNLLDERPEHARQVRLEQPVLTHAAMAGLRAIEHETLRPVTLSALFDAAAGPDGLASAVETLCLAAERAVRDGAGILVLSDRDTDAAHAAIPSLLAVSAVHHHLGRVGLRTSASLVVETGEARDVSQVALLVGYGASAVHPYLALETIAELARRGELAGEPSVDEACARYVKAVGKGLLKVLSKMGISTLQSYCGAQIFEALGLGAAFVDRYFTGTASRLGGIGIDVVAEEALRRHAAAYSEDVASLDPGSDYHYRINGEHHNWNPRTIATLQHATRANDARTFAEFSALADAETSSYSLRGLLDFVETEPIPLDDVESEAAIVKRFVTGAMSFGSLSQEAHETLAIAMNRIGGRSNTGEGGEDRDRFNTERSSAVKQVASGRFGVTTEYLVNASELQIKIAQGAKPGEGGQLPGHKVDENIARTRCATPGVSLISPPPHHDIYSIEDLKQLIHDLANVNPDAAISVKLVAESGIGTIAAGVAKAHSALIVVSGDSGGTGASPLSSIKQTGAPWELGLAEVQQTLLMNGLRGRVRLQTDGQLKTGRDVVVAALLGADEFGFATAPLIVEGCVMMRKCHLNTCPVGVATQDPALRAKFTGQPEHVVNYFFFVAREVRALMAKLGVRTMDELVGRTELLRAAVPEDHWKARHLDLSDLLHVPTRAREASLPRRFVARHDPAPLSRLDLDLLELARPVLDRGGRIATTIPVSNVDRSIGTLLSGEIARRFGADGLADGTISVRCRGSAGQSFGAFAVRGLTLELEGEANDYVGKGLSGGRLVIHAPRRSHFVPEETAIVGNTVLYGATSGEAYIGGLAGQRFAVRNSGAMAVVEGVGDHGCEYMTGGVVVVLGRTGRNFAAGMSGGTAFVLDESESREFRQRCNRALVELQPVESADDRALLRHLVEQHARFTGSARARYLLSRWEQALRDFVAVVPTEYQRAMREREQRAEVNRYG